MSDTSTLKKSGSSTIKGPLIANGGANFSNNNFIIEVDSGNTHIKGDLFLYNTLNVDKDTFIGGNLSISSGLFKVSKTGDTFITGDLEVNGITVLKQDFELRNTSGEVINKINVQENGFTYFLGSYIGMGTSKPSYRLDVEGNINVGLGYTYKIAGEDVVFSQWETINGKDISYNKGNTFINIDDTSSLKSVYGLNIGGTLSITGNQSGTGQFMLNDKTFEQNVLDTIPYSKYASQWSNTPKNSTISSTNNKEIESIYSQYKVQIAELLSIGTSIDSKYTLAVGGSGINLQGDAQLYFNGKQFFSDLWSVYNNANAANIDSKYIYFSTSDEEDVFPSISYVGIGTSRPKYNLDVYGDVNIKGNLLIDGNGVIFPSANEEGQPTSDWTEGSKSGDNQTLYYNGGFVGIGTDNPTSLLTVYGKKSINGNILNLGSQTSSSYLTISRTTTNEFESCKLGFTDESNKLLLKNLLSNGTISIENFGGGKLYMDTTGNIGIGTSSPSDRLHVNGSATFDDDITLTKNGSKLIIFNQTNSGTAVDDNKDRIALQHSSNDMLEIDPNASYTGGLKIAGTMCLVKGDNDRYLIGVNVAKPTFEFDIDGSINYTGDLRQNGVIQSPSQWQTKYDAAVPYLLYPHENEYDSDTQRVKVGLGVKTADGESPNACLEIFDRQTSNQLEFYPQLMLISTIDSYTNKGEGTTFELNTYSKDLKKFYKGIRLHTVNDSTSTDTTIQTSQVGFAIDTNNNNSTTEPFINIFRLANNGNLGLGNFLDTNAPQDPGAKLHIMNPTTDQPALIITDNKNPNNPEKNVSDLNIICSKDQSSNLGYSSKIIGLNIKRAISDNNKLEQNSINDTSKGACAINLSAGGANGGAIAGPNFTAVNDANAQSNIWRNASALGVLFTDASTDAGPDQELKENFSISYNGNVGIRTYNSPDSEASGPEYGIDLRHHASDTNSALRHTGSINVTGNYYINGKLQHSPWSYLQSSIDANVKSYTTKYDANFAAVNDGNNSVYDTPNNNLTITVNNNIHQIDSCLGIGTTAPRGMCDIRGSLYAKYMIINSDKIDNGNGLSLMNARFENGSTSDNSIHQPSGVYSAEESVLLLQKYSTGETILNSVADGHIKLRNMGRDLAVFVPRDGSYDQFQIQFYGNTEINGDPNGRSRLHINGPSSHLYCQGYIQTDAYAQINSYLNVGTTITSGGDITS